MGSTPPAEARELEQAQVTQASQKRIVRRTSGTRADTDARGARISQLLTQVKAAEAEAEGSYQFGNAKYDWAAIKDFYLNYYGEIELSTVARQFGVPLQQIYNRSSKEGWREERTITQAQLLRDRRAERTVDMARRAQEFDDRAYDTAKLGLNLVTSRMAQIADQFTVQRAQFERALERSARGEAVTKADFWSSINYRELVELGKSLELFQNVGRRALGTDVQTIAMLLDNQTNGVVDTKIASITEELLTPDPDRLVALIDSLVDAKFVDLQFDEGGNVIGLNIVDAEVIEDEPKAIESTPATEVA